MGKPIAVYQFCGNLGINIFSIDDYSESVFWQWSDEAGELRESSIQYDPDGNPFFATSSDLANIIYLSECVRL